MGDIREFVTTKLHGRMCFKISSGVNFDVKTHAYATLGLSKKLGKKSDILVTIGSSSWIRNVNGDGIQIETPELLDAYEYRRFWLLCTNELIAIGKSGHVEPFLKYSCKSPKSMYVTFLSYESHEPVYWRVEFPPQLKEPPLKKIDKGNLHWVSAKANDQVPEDALIGGFENENLYIVRAKHERTTVSGKFVPSKGIAIVPMSSTALEKTDFEILCGYNCKWVPTKDDRIPVGAVGAGCSEFTKALIYVARGSHKGHLIPGHIAIPGGICYLPYEDQEIPVYEFEVMAIQREWRCVHKNLRRIPNIEPHDIREFLGDVQESDERDGYFIDSEFWTN